MSNDYLSDLHFWEMLGLIMLGLTLLWTTISGISSLIHGYWKDVGTVDSLWEANMDLLKDKDLDLYNIKKDWKIYTEDTLGKPQIIGEKAEVKNSLVTQGCMVNGTVEGSVLFNNVNVGEGAKVVDSVLMPGVLVEEGAEIYKAIIDENVVVKAGTVINSEAKEVELVSDNSR